MVENDLEIIRKHNKNYIVKTTNNLGMCEIFSDVRTFSKYKLTIVQSLFCLIVSEYLFLKSFSTITAASLPEAFQRVFGRLFNILGDDEGFDAKVCT